MESPTGANQLRGESGPNLVRQVLGGMDLRGLTPEDVYQLMGHGLQDKQLTMMDQYRKGQLEQEAGLAAQRDKIAKQKLGIDYMTEERLQRNQEAELSRPRDLGTYTANGKTYLRYVDPKTNQIATRDLGDAGEKLQNKKLLKDADGNGYWVGPNDPIRPGSTYLASQDNGFSINDQYTLSFLKSGIESGKDQEGRDMDESTRDNNMTLVNLNDKTHQFVKVPTVKESVWGNSVVPKYVKLPKEPAQLKALPNTQVVGYDEEEGKSITMAEIRETAKRTGQPVDMVFKYLGLIK